MTFYYFYYSISNGETAKLRIFQKPLTRGGGGVKWGYTKHQNKQGNKWLII